VDADGRAVVAGMNFHAGEGRVALVTEGLARIGADLHGPAGFHHRRQRKKSYGEAGAFTAIEESKGRTKEFFAASEFGLGIVVVLFAERVAGTVDGVAGEARDGGLVNDGGRQKLPRAIGVEWRDEIADATFKEHAVAAKAIIHQQAIVVVLLIEENRFVSESVRAVLPLSSFLLMALLAAADHHVNVHRAQANGVAVSAANVLNEAANIAQVEARIKREDFAVTRATRDGAVAGGLPGRVLGTDFVTAGAGFSGGVFIVEAGGGEAKNNQEADGKSEESQTGVEKSHG
jgi:hypothetical protein